MNKFKFKFKSGNKIIIDGYLLYIHETILGESASKSKYKVSHDTAKGVRFDLDVPYVHTYATNTLTDILKKL